MQLNVDYRLAISKVGDGNYGYPDLVTQKKQNSKLMYVLRKLEAG